MIRENIEHLRDAYQSNLDLRLNQTMKIFTVFTVLFHRCLSLSAGTV